MYKQIHNKHIFKYTIALFSRTTNYITLDNAKRQSKIIWYSQETFSTVAYSIINAFKRYKTG